jgi:hypothetical protein
MDNNVVALGRGVAEVMNISLSVPSNARRSLLGFTDFPFDTRIWINGDPRARCLSMVSAGGKLGNSRLPVVAMR